MAPRRRRAGRRHRRRRGARDRGAGGRAAARCASRCRRCSTSATPTACRTFLSFQWDNLLLECGLLAVLPAAAARASPLAHFLFRCVLFKLYFESGIAKWQSPIARLAGRQRDDVLLRDRAAADRARLVRAQPAGRPGTTSRAGRCWRWSWSSPSRSSARGALRLAAAALFTGFQIVNIATANYGFFCYLALALHVFLLDDARRRARAQRAGAAARACARRCGERSSAALRPRRRATGRARPCDQAARAGAAVFIVVLAVVQGAVRASPSASGSLSRASSRCVEVDAAVPPDQHLSPVRGHHARAHRARVPDQRRRRTTSLDRARPAPQAGRPGARARLRRAAPAARRLPALVLRPRASSAGEPAYVASCSSGCATTRPPSARCSARRCPSTPTRCGSSTGDYHFTTRRRAARDRTPGGGAKSVGATRAVPCRLALGAVHTMRKASLGTIFLTVFLDLLGFGLVIPFLPGVARHLGASDFVATLTGGRLLADAVPVRPGVGPPVRPRRPPARAAVQHRRHRRRHGAAGLRATRWCCCSSARLWSGIATANIAVAQAYIADVTPPEGRARGMGLIGMAFGLGFIFGPFVGRRAGARARSTAGPARLPAFVAAGLSLVNLVFALVTLPESLPRERARQVDAAVCARSTSSTARVRRRCRRARPRAARSTSWSCSGSPAWSRRSACSPTTRFRMSDWGRPAASSAWSASSPPSCRAG